MKKKGRPKITDREKREVYIDRELLPVFDNQDNRSDFINALIRKYDKEKAEAFSEVFKTNMPCE